MTARQSMLMVIVAALAFGWASTAGAATAAQRCEAAKLKASGDKAKCLLKAEANSVKSGNPPNTTQCVTNFDAAFAAAETNAGPGVCPTEGDVNDIEALVDFCRDDVAAALSGFPPPPCGQFPASGQTSSFRDDDDGDLEAGATLNYTDTGNGTIIDNNTGLEWEKKSDDEAANDNDNTTFPHDKDNVYTWENAFAVHVAGLNTAPCFAGTCDWRLPNVKELQSIVNYEVPFPGPVVLLAFNNSCDPGDTVLDDGSCTAASIYWSSTTLASFSDVAWGVNFNGGGVGVASKNVDLHVRAVRGGL